MCMHVQGSPGSSAVVAHSWLEGCANAGVMLAALPHGDSSHSTSATTVSLSTVQVVVSFVAILRCAQAVYLGATHHHGALWVQHSRIFDNLVRCSRLVQLAMKKQAAIASPHTHSRTHTTFQVGIRVGSWHIRQPLRAAVSVSYCTLERNGRDWVNAHGALQWQADASRLLLHANHLQTMAQQVMHGANSSGLQVNNLQCSTDLHTMAASWALPPSLSAHACSAAQEPVLVPVGPSSAFNASVVEWWPCREQAWWALHRFCLAHGCNAAPLLPEFSARAALQQEGGEQRCCSGLAANHSVTGAGWGGGGQCQSSAWDKPLSTLLFTWGSATPQQRALVAAIASSTPGLHVGGSGEFSTLHTMHGTLLHGAATGDVRLFSSARQERVGNHPTAAQLRSDIVSPSHWDQLGVDNTAQVTDSDVLHQLGFQTFSVNVQRGLDGGTATVTPTQAMGSGALGFLLLHVPAPLAAVQGAVIGCAQLIVLQELAQLLLGSRYCYTVLLMHNTATMRDSH